jgi:D-alanyl-lipoteichoic acid acyltransferase DltB (MBOAT superfamily)
MPFNSVQYFLFLPLVYLVFYCVPDRARWGVLLAASFCFYSALKVPYLPAVLALVTLVTYAFGIWVDGARTQGAKRAFLWSGIAANVLILVGMKYLPFLSENLGTLAKLFSPGADVTPVQALVAIGVSYYIFQAISYLFDIYLEIDTPERHLGYFALHLAFFPKLLQGPIERSCDLIPQLREKYLFNYENARLGMLLFTWGLFKKVVVADRIAPYVDNVYNNVHAFKGLPLLLATYAYSFQIFFDFSGYTDMALGSALLFNIRLTQNFNRPYLATSVADFWRRWHISFSRWILDYIFKPLQMQWRSLKNWGSAAALVIAFLVSGIWHGASWGFVIWGGLHGLFMACSIFYKPYQKKLHKALGVEKTRLLKWWQVFVTFNLVSFAWIFFRAATLADAWYVASNLFNGAEGVKEAFLFLRSHELIMTLVSVAIFVLLSALFRQEKLQQLFSKSAFKRYLAYNSLLFCLILLAKYGATKSFIYFQF